MRTLYALFACAITLALIPTLALASEPPGRRADAPALSPSTTPLTVNLNLGGEPTTLDPSLAADSNSFMAIEQLFIGLVDLDDTTSAVQPELATSWTASPNGTVYTFTLRSDVNWSDGQPVTAQDVRYGILRTLSPTVNPSGAHYAYTLFIIKNAQGYNSGTIADPNQVGVTALDNTHLRVTFEYPAAYGLAVLSLPGARPLPQWAIGSWGSAWTDPSHIVTSGAYRLTEWVHGDHILLDKNTTYYGAAQVQIERVKLWMVGESTAWTMFLNGQLDTANVPAGTSLDALLKQQVHIQPIAGTYYYGFNITKPPFDKPLVRKAFIAAVDRQGLINSVVGGVQRPALTFTSPGVFGNVDGAAEGVGIPYDVAQAQQWLAQAGYPNGQGLPPVTLWYNTSSSHQAIAEYIRQNWYANLGVSVTLQNIAWSTYLTQAHNGQYQVWRMGWNADYLDANNFVVDGIKSQGAGFGNWSNSGYNSLVAQAAREQNPDTRKALYKQAEEILVETDAVMLPVYYNTAIVATRPHLERTYSAGKPDIGTWRVLQTAATIPPTGGTVTSYYGDTTIQVPAGAVTDTIVVTYAPSVGMPPDSSLAGIDHVFDATAVYSETGAPAQLVPGQTFTINVHYTGGETLTVREDTLGLYHWDGSQWIRESSSGVNTTTDIVSATTSHLSLWAVFGETERVHVPLIRR